MSSWEVSQSVKCSTRVPEAMSGHGKGGKRWPKAEKGLDKDDSLYIFKTTGVFVAVGSGNYSYSS